uniref:Two-component sensor histidine kinase n=1 Tax=Rhabditophanes sp. KR3021 TaxID=114890 RepID=A0AC35UGH2_9BILA
MIINDQGIKLRTFPVSQLLSRNAKFNDTADVITYKNDIIWSRESRFHPEYSKTFKSLPDNIFSKRDSSLSMYVSFTILGGIILFIVAAMIHHVLSVNEPKQLEKRRDEILKQMENSISLIAHPVGLDFEVAQLQAERSRKKSLTDIFRQFKL